jgi:hypothetical protein
MRSPTAPVSAEKARECLSLTIHVLYSFWRTRLSERGWMPPWQLVEAQEPGPVYLPAPSAADGLDLDCEKLWGGRRQAVMIAATERRKMRSGCGGVASSFFFNFRLGGWGTLRRNRRKIVNEPSSYTTRLLGKSTKSRQGRTGSQFSTNDFSLASA